MPGQNELILSFHPDTRISDDKTLRFYRAVLTKYAYLVHMTYVEAGNLIIQSYLTDYATADDIVANAVGVLVTYNPQQTDLESLDVYRNWFNRHYSFCRRFVQKPENVIDYYLRADVPCELIIAGSPFSIRYQNGTQLANLLVEQTADLLNIHLRWTHTIDERYSFTLQVFNFENAKVMQIDRVIVGESIKSVSFNTSALADGEYTVKLIVYDFQTKESQSGAFIRDGTPFERSVNIHKFSIDK